MGLYTRGLYSWGLIYGTTFVSGVFHTCYLYLKKEESNKTKKRQCSCSKMPFYYLAENKTRDAFHNSGPLAALRVKHTWEGALILGELDLLKITRLHIIFFLLFYNGLKFGRGGGFLYSEGIIYGTTFMLVFWWAYIRWDLYSRGLIFGVLRYSTKISRFLLYALLGSFNFLVLSYVLRCSCCLDKFVGFSS